MHAEMCDISVLNFTLCTCGQLACLTKQTTRQRSSKQQTALS